MARQRPVFYLFAGPNGAGKSTLYKALVAAGKIPRQAEFVNADLYEAAQLQHIKDAEQRSVAARQWADTRRSTLLAQGVSFASETVFSHESKLALITEAQQRGIEVRLFVVALDDPQHLIGRVAQRVGEGGHSVPQERILARYPRTLALLQRAVRMADVALLHDSLGTHQLVAYCQAAQIHIVHMPLPHWAQQVLGMLQNLQENDK